MPLEDDLNQAKKDIAEINKAIAKQTQIYGEVAGVSKQTREGEAVRLKQLEEMAKALLNHRDIGEGNNEQTAKAILEQIELAKKLNAEYTKQYSARGRILGEFKKGYEENKKFFTTQAAIYNLSEKIAKEYKSIQTSAGLSKQQTRALSATFRAALPEVISMGGELGDITQVYGTFLEETGRKRIFTEDDLITVNAISQATKMLPSDVAMMSETFDLMGHSVESMNESLVDVYDASQKAGLNSTKVIKTLQSNIKQMSSFSFVNGVRGMTEMARQAVKMRLDVSDVLSMADKFYQPEAAIEAAANLQMLGGDIAKAFGDPFETMYLARNKPEELAKKLQDMTENMLQFNAESGEFELPAEARMQLKSAGDQLGINVDKMTEMARQSSKIGKVKMEIDGNAFDDEVREGIAGMAKMKDGKWVVDFSSPTGEKMEIDINNTEQLRDAVDQGLLDTQKSDTDLFRDISMNTQTMSERIQNQSEGQQYLATAVMDYEAVYEKALGPTISAGFVESQKFFSRLADESATGTKFALEQLEKTNQAQNEFLNILNDTGISLKNNNILNQNNNGTPNPNNIQNPGIPSNTPNLQNINSNYTGTMNVSVNVTGDANSAIDKVFLTNTIASVVQKQISNGLEVVTDGTNIEVVLKE